MIAVLDVSGAIQVLLKNGKRPKFDEEIKKSSWVIAPDLYVSEISNVLWKYFKANLISHEDCIQSVEDGISLIDDFFDAKQLWKEALGEGIKNSHSVYDMYYAVLARRNDATLITNDKALSEIGLELKISVCY